MMQFELNHALDVLSRTPGVLRTLLAGLPADWTERPYGPNTWSAKEVLAHLVYGERTDWIPRLQIILEHGDEKPFEPFDRTGHADLLASNTLGQLLDLFERERADGLATLRGLNLGPADFERRGRHPALGAVTLGNLLATWVVHDLNHIAQACKATAHQYREAVGPWEQYLSILSPPNPR